MELTQSDAIKTQIHAIREPESTKKIERTVTDDTVIRTRLDHALTNEQRLDHAMKTGRIS